MSFFRLSMALAYSATIFLHILILFLSYLILQLREKSRTDGVHRVRAMSSVPFPDAAPATSSEPGQREENAHTVSLIGKHQTKTEYLSSTPQIFTVISNQYQ